MKNEVNEYAEWLSDWRGTLLTFFLPMDLDQQEERKIRDSDTPYDASKSDGGRRQRTSSDR